MATYPKNMGFFFVNMLKKVFSKKITWVLLIIILIVGGIITSKGKNKNGTTTSAVEKGTVVEELILTGQIKADKHALLTFPTSGIVSWVGVKEGESVKKGRALTSLNKTVLNAAYQQALNNYRNYQAAAENALDLVKGHSADESFSQKASRTAAEVARDNAYDSVRAAEYNLRNSTLYAPFDGVISSLPFSSPGVSVSLTDTQVEILDPESIYFEVEADQSEVINLAEGQKVVIVLDSYRDKELTGTISVISLTPKPGEAGTIYRVKVQLDNVQLTGSLPRTGMTGDAKFVLSQKEDVFYAPPKFIHSDKDGKYVFLGGKNKKVRITVGIEGEERVEITSGVKEGDTLYD